MTTLVAGRYRLLEVLGRGGMGEVWRGIDDVLDRPVAVKLLHPDPARPDAATGTRDRFTRECRLAARLSHPNIVGVFDAGEDEHGAYLVMECLPGVTLRDRIAAGPLSDAEARAMSLDVLAALEFAHRAGIVHRDVKPANVLAGSVGGWKLADFGIAKGIGPRDDLTRTGEVLGTLRYLAPERIAGSAANPASDLFSAGVVLQEALAGRPDADPVLVAVAARATDPDPARRFASAESMAAALDAPATAAMGPSAIGGEATVAMSSDGPPTAVLADAPAAPPRRAAWAAAVVGALLLVGAVAGAWWVARTSDPQSPRTTVDHPTTEPASASTTSAPPSTAAPSTVAPTTVAPSTVAPTATTRPPKPPPVGPTKPQKPGHGHKPHKG